jgi:hypothetical protein
MAVVSALGFVAASLVAAVATAAGRPRLRRLARGIALAASAPLVLLAARPSAQPFVALGLVAALPVPQPLALALGAGAAALAGLIPATGSGSVAAVLAGAAVALAAHAVDRSVSSHLAAGRDAAWSSSAAGVAACGLVVALDGGRALRWDYGVVSGPVRIDAPDAGLLLGLVLLASLAGGLLLAADALAAADAPPASPLARLLARRALLLGAGFALIAAGLVLRAAGWGEGIPLDGARDAAVLVTVVGLLAGAVPALLAERVSGDALEDEQSATVLSRLVVVTTLAAVLSAGVEGWLRSGTYLTPFAQRLLAAALVGFAATETTRGRGIVRALTLGTLLVALLA